MQYVSPWLTHFVGHKHPDDDNACCAILLKILEEGQLGQWEIQGSVYIDPGSMKVSITGSLCKDEFISFRPICFCDIPDESLGRHTGIYGCFGLAFPKEFLVARGANLVFYIAKGSIASHERPPVPPLTLEDLKADSRAALNRHFQASFAKEAPIRRCEFFDRLVAQLASVLATPGPPSTDTANDGFQHIHRLDAYFNLIRHVFSFMKFYDESLLEEDPDNYYMEREWRVAGFVEFELDDLQWIYVAQTFADRIENQFPELKGKVRELRTNRK